MNSAFEGAGHKQPVDTGSQSVKGSAGDRVAA